MEQRGDKKSSYLRTVPSICKEPIARLDVKPVGHDMFEFQVTGADINSVRALQREIELAAPELARSKNLSRR